VTIDRRIDELPEPAAVPRRNGELVFAAPWEGRAFGMVMAMAEAEVFDWEDFRRRLIERIASAGPATPYYESWLAAFEDAVLSRKLVGPPELHTRAEEFRTLERDGAF
jgi:nitrile hydratase accessory protein